MGSKIGLVVGVSLLAAVGASVTTWLVVTKVRSAALEARLEGLARQQSDREETLREIDGKIESAEQELANLRADLEFHRCEAKLEGIKARARLAYAEHSRLIAVFMGCQAEQEAKKAKSGMWGTILGVGLAAATGGSSLLLAGAGAAAGNVVAPTGACPAQPLPRAENEFIVDAVAEEGLGALPVCTRVVVPPIATPSRKYVSVSALNLRRGPDAASALVGKIKIGTECAVLQQQGDWAQVRCGGESGYCKAEFLSNAMPTADALARDAEAATASKDAFDFYLRALTLRPDRVDLAPKARDAFFKTQFKLLDDIRANPSRRPPKQVQPPCTSTVTETCLKQALSLGESARVERRGDDFDVIEFRSGSGLKAQEYLGRVRSSSTGSVVEIEHDVPYREPPEAFAAVFGRAP